MRQCNYILHRNRYDHQPLSVISIFFFLEHSHSDFNLKRWKAPNFYHCFQFCHFFFYLFFLFFFCFTNRNPKLHSNTKYKWNNLIGQYIYFQTYLNSQTAKIQIRRLIMGRLIYIFTLCSLIFDAEDRCFEFLFVNVSNSQFVSD